MTVRALNSPRFSPADVLAVVKQTWGFDALRPIQEEAIRAGLDARDSLVVMPTGGGKSLCYQVPPLLTGRMGIVVSPLISLMKDQVDGLRLNGYPAGALHSNLPLDQARGVERAVVAGKFRLLFVSPERLFTPHFQGLIRRLHITSFSVDEAHCISQWGHDFRPEYRRLAELRDAFPQAAMHGYTATATERVRDDIVDQLHLREPTVLVGRFDRPNLVYRVVPRLGLLDQILEVVERHPGRATIIYCISRRDTEEIAAALSVRGVEAKPYHAGLSAEVRRATQEDFSQERLNVVVATVAFGMGIDRSDVRCVIHAAMPKSIEAYQQETGRSGRDGLEAECVLLYSAADVVRWQRLVGDNAEDTESSRESVAIQMDLLDKMHRLAAGMICRHKALSEYFGQAYEPPCRACDVCLGEMAQVEGATVIAQKILSCVARVNQGFGAAHVIDVLRGSANARVRERGHDQLSTFGLLRDARKEVLSSYINQLIDQGVLNRSAGSYPVLWLNEASREVLRGRREVALLSPKAPVETDRPADTEAGRAPAHPGLFESLRVLRRQIAEERSVPPYIIFGDATLQDMAAVRPTTTGSMLNVRGVGERKLADLGQRFIDHIAAYCRERGLETDTAAAAAPRRQRGASKADRTGGSTIERQSLNKRTSFELFRRGYSIDETAQAMPLSPRTLTEHLAEFIEATAPASISRWVDAETYATVAGAAAAVGSLDLLKPIHEHLGGSIDYDRIRLVVAHLRAAAGA